MGTVVRPWPPAGDRCTTHAGPKGCRCSGVASPSSADRAREIVIADKGLWSRAYSERLAADDVRLLTPDRTRTAGNLGRKRALGSTRLIIESVFANLKGQMRLERHLACSARGFRKGWQIRGRAVRVRERARARCGEAAN